MGAPLHSNRARRWAPVPVSRWIIRRLNRASASLGRCLAATRLWFVADTPYITTPPGAWAVRDYGRIRRSLRNRSVHNSVAAPLRPPTVPLMAERQMLARDN